MTAPGLALSFIAAFAIGSIPFSSIAVRLAGKDISTYGEGNPGAANAFRAGGLKVGIPSLILDSFKGVVSIALLVSRAAHWQIPIIAIAPVLGHAFSPFLRFRGGKAIATSFGIWTALTVWWAPTAMGLGALSAAFLLKGTSDIRKIPLIFASLGVSLIFAGSGADMWALFAANLSIVIYKQHQYSKLPGR